MNDQSPYQLPLAMLRGVLGPWPAAELPCADGLYFRRWNCGCSVRYRDTAHQTAAWNPCLSHRSEPSVSAGITGATTLAPDVLGRRLGPTFCIVDTGLKVLCKSPGAEVDGLLESARAHLRECAASGEARVVPHDGNALLRIMPLRGQRSGTFAIVIERLRSRGSLTEAASRFGLTKRESDVLGLIVANRTNAEIAAHLCIAESTVSDYLKSLFRKVGCNRRTELLTKLFLV